MYYFYSKSNKKFCAYSENSVLLKKISNIINIELEQSLFDNAFNKIEIHPEYILKKIKKSLSDEIMSSIQERYISDGVIFSFKIVHFKKMKLILNVRNEVDNIIFNLILVLDLIEFCIHENESFVIERKEHATPNEILLKMG
ncbi:hypothetical protein EQG63_04755 [Flavobacterium amnicola]|uniref:Uncharacterized protein n=1 Tax=Flavobacterium amnicola TaxID=2506422 RepID=A0A4Q1K6L8_9FLAO|nr:hypothetical protein [Flavobacterium amnicola]RXR21252.1 hypothetical protein EQG63_04755 [Flavobacterium amnicola]